MTAFWMAWIMFCYIPCPCQKWDDSKKQPMLSCFPLIGLLIGILEAAALWIFKCLEIKYLGAALLSFLPWMLCGFIHLDGFMDCADAVLSCRDKEKRLEILKDSHVGAFAVVSVVILAMLSFAAWIDAIEKANLSVVPFIFMASRAAAGSQILLLDPMPTSSYAAIHKEGINKKYIFILIAEALIACAAGVGLGGIKGFAPLIACLCTIITVFTVRKKLGAMSGDISGCSICIGELMGIICLSIL